MFIIMTVVVIDSPYGYHLLTRDGETDMRPSIVKELKLLSSYRFENFPLGVVINQKIENKNILPDQISEFISKAIDDHSDLMDYKWYFISDSLLNLIKRKFHVKCDYLPPLVVRAINENAVQLLNTTEKEYDEARMALASEMYSEEALDFQGN